MFNQSRFSFLRRKRRRSLAGAAQRTVLLVALIIFLLSSVLNWYVQQQEARFTLSLQARQAAFTERLLAQNLKGFEDYALSVMETYRSVPEQVRQAQDESYFSYFQKFEQSDYVRSALKNFASASSQFLPEDLYLVMFDQDTMTMVYLLDPPDIPDETPHRIGEWRETTPEEIDTYFYDPQEEEHEDAVNIRANLSDRLAQKVTAGFQMQNEAGLTYAYAMADLKRIVANIYAILFTMIYLGVLLVAVVIILLVTSAMMRRRIVLPIRKIGEAVSRYMQDKKEDRISEQYFDQLHLNTGDELEELSRVLSEMETDISVYEKNLMKTTAENERMLTELSVAYKIQQDLLPTDFPAFPDRKEFDVYAVMDPAREIGGDFYDFFLLDENHLGLVIADVSGKGIPAALFMMSAMIIVQNFASEGYSPAVVLEKTNARLYAANMNEMFVTVWLGILDLRTGEMTAANAGHEFPVIRHANGDFEILRDPHSFVLGALGKIRTKDYTITLEPGSTLFVYSDGVPEACNEREEMYGTTRLLDALNRAKNEPPRQLLATVRADIDAFVKDAPQYDDLTMMGFLYLGPQEETSD